jgi:DNA-binding transcriptional MerR regulator/effector-binding domain-containing protein
MYTIGEFASIGRVSVRMLRHYDAIGLLKPARVDPFTGYRSYDDDQFGRLLEVLAYKDLGLRLEAIAAIVDGSADVEEIEALLVERHAQLQAELVRGAAALDRIETKLHHLRGAPSMSSTPSGPRTSPTPTLGSTPPIRVAELTEPTPELDSSVITLVIGPLFDRLAGLLAERRVEPVGPPIACYTVADTGPDAPAVVHAAFPVPPDVDGGSDFAVLDYPAVPSYAALTHHGSMDSIADSWQQLGRWVDAQPDLRPRGDCREVYLVTSPHDDQSGWVTELQWPVERT